MLLQYRLSTRPSLGPAPAEYVQLTVAAVLALCKLSFDEARSVVDCFDAELSMSDEMLYALKTAYFKASDFQ